MCKLYFGIISLLLTLNGCVVIPIPYFPLHRQYSGKEPSEIHIGSTTRSQIIELLGEANILDEEGYFLTEVDSRSPGFYILAGGFGLGGSLIQVADLTVLRVLIEFDEMDIVRRIETTGMLPKDTSNEIDKIDSWITKPTDISKATYKTTLETGPIISYASVYFSPDNRWLIGLDKRSFEKPKLFVWDVNEILLNSEIRPKFQFENSWFLKFSPDQIYFATLTNNYGYFRNLQRSSHTLEIHNFISYWPRTHITFDEPIIDSFFEGSSFSEASNVFEPRLLGAYYDSVMDWSSDGKKIAFSLDRVESSQLWIYLET